MKIKPTDLDRREHRRLARIVHEREYRDGEYICEHGKPGAALFVLRKGPSRSSGAVATDARCPWPCGSHRRRSRSRQRRWGQRRFAGSPSGRGPVSLLALGKSDLDAMIVNFPVLANKVLIKLAGLMAVRLQFVLEAQDLLESHPNPEPEE